MPVIHKLSRTFPVKPYPDIIIDYQVVLYNRFTVDSFEGKPLLL